MNFKKWVKSIQTAGYNGARTVYYRAVGDSENLGRQVALELVVDKQTSGLTYKGPAREQT
jgi:hypothetical protein